MRHAALERLREDALAAVAVHPWQAALLLRAALPRGPRTRGRSQALLPADEA
jgi:hypothetical protein